MVTKVEGEVFTHRELWAAAKDLAERASREERGAFYPRISSMLMAYFAVEAYANFLLSVLDPPLFAREKDEFGSSLERKLEWACGRATIKLEKGHPPYQTIARLEDLRHLVVHAKPQRYQERHEGVDPDDLRVFQAGELKTRVSVTEWQHVMKDIPAFCQRLHEAILPNSTSEQRLRLQGHALEGTTQMQTVHSSVVGT